MSSDPYYAAKLRRLPIRVETEVIDLINSGDPAAAMLKMAEETGLPMEDCQIWVKHHICSPGPLPMIPVRCPYCGRMLMTDKAKQCLVCGMDWHDPNNVVRHGPCTTLLPRLRHERENP